MLSLFIKAEYFALIQAQTDGVRSNIIKRALFNQQKKRLTLQ